MQRFRNMIAIQYIDTIRKEINNENELCNENCKTFSSKFWRANERKVYDGKRNISIFAEKVVEQEKYSLIRFVTDIGGSLGLFLGISLLGIFDFDFNIKNSNDSVVIKIIRSSIKLILTL